MGRLALIRIGNCAGKLFPQQDFRLRNDQLGISWGNRFDQFD